MSIQRLTANARLPVRDPSTPIAQPAPSAPSPDPRDILNSINAVIYDWNLVTDRLTWGANVSETLADFPAGALTTGDSFADLLAARSETSRFQAIRGSGQPISEDGVPYRASYGLVKPSGGVIAVEDFGRWFADASGRPARAHGVLRVIARRKDDEEAAAAFGAARRDPLTGAFLRGYLIERLTEQCASLARRNAPFAVMMVGVERLAALNHRLGYDVADEVIVAVSRRLHDCVRSSDTVARYLGGKFVIILDNCDAEQCPLSAQRILRAVSETPIRTSRGEVSVSLRIGAALAPKHGRAPQALLQRAEEAHELASQDAGKAFALFAPRLMADGAEARVISVCDEIVSALNERRVTVAYQAVVPTHHDKPPYYEALLRIRREDGGLTGPAAIVPIAEKVGLIGQIDQRVLELALKRMVDEPDLRIAVNASPQTMLEAGWLARFAHTLAIHPGAAQRLILEVTESLPIADVEGAARLLREVKALGVRVAVDDFGAGHTSFRNLRGLGVDIVKIDGAFIQNIARSADDRFFVRTLVDLARHLNMETVAEWVEDADAMRILIDWGVDYLQGRHLGDAEVIADTADEPTRMVLRA